VTWLRQGWRERSLHRCRARATPVPVTNVQLRAVEARRYQDPQQGQAVRIDHNSHIGVVQMDGANTMRVEFAYTTSYGPVGVVKLEGLLAFQGPESDAAVKAWQETRNLPAEIAQQVHGAIMAACVPEAVSLAKDLRLPPPIPLPQIRFQKQGDATATAKGPADSPEIG
jgi:hypothetical protein